VCGEESCIQGFVRNPEEKRPPERCEDARIILGLIFSNWDIGSWMGSISFKIRTGDGHL
jgi:hypothetical protein